VLVSVAQRRAPYDASVFEGSRVVCLRVEREGEEDQEEGEEEEEEEEEEGGKGGVVVHKRVGVLFFRAPHHL
jgi:hypothetical protein